MRVRLAMLTFTLLLSLALAGPVVAASDFARELCEEVARQGLFDFDTCMWGSRPMDPDIEAAMQAMERCWDLPGDEGVKCIQSISAGFQEKLEMQQAMETQRHREVVEARRRHAKQAAQQAEMQRATETRRHRTAKEPRRRQAEQAARQAETQRAMEAQLHRKAEEARRLAAEADLENCYGANYDPDPSQRKPLGEMLVQNSGFCLDDSVDACLRAGADENAEGVFGTTALHSAANGHCVDNIQTLVARGAKVNVKDIQGNTPLHEAAYVGIAMEDSFVGTVRALLAAGADVHARNSDGETPLFGVGSPTAYWNIQQALKSDTVWMIARPDDLDQHIAEILVRAGADPCARDTMNRIAYPDGCLRTAGLRQ